VDSNNWIIGIADSDLLGDGTEFFIGQGTGGLNSNMVIKTDGNVGIGVTDPDTRLELFHAGNQLKLSFDGTDNATFGVDTDGDLTITPSGGDVTIASTVNATTFVGALTGTASGNLVSGGALGTPSAGTLTNCDGTAASLTAGAVSTITGLAPDTATTQATQASITTCTNLVTVGTLATGSIASGFGTINIGTSNAVSCGILELGHASDTTLARSAAGVIAVEGVVIPSISSTNTLTNKRITKRVKTFTSDATPDIDSDDYDAVTITALAADITDVNVTGTPTNFQHLMFRIKDDGTEREIAWGSDFEAGGVALPDTTVAGKTLLVEFIYDSVDSKWACEATSSRA